MGPCCSASISGGVHGHPSLMSPDEASPGNGLLLFFRVDDFNMALNRARALVTPARRGAPREPEHSNKGVLTARSGRILRHHQRALAWIKTMQRLTERLLYTKRSSFVSLWRT